jgi:hypothetical protein
LSKKGKQSRREHFSGRVKSPPAMEGFSLAGIDLL